MDDLPPEADYEGRKRIEDEIWARRDSIHLDHFPITVPVMATGARQNARCPDGRSQTIHDRALTHVSLEGHP